MKVKGVYARDGVGDARSSRRGKRDGEVGVGESDIANFWKYLLGVSDDTLACLTSTEVNIYKSNESITTHVSKASDRTVPVEPSIEFVKE